MNDSIYTVGSVIEINGTSIKIRLFENSDQLFYFYEGIRYSGINIGSFIGIKKFNYLLIARVEREYAYDKLKDDTKIKYSKDRFIREIEVKIIGSIKNEKFTPGISIFPQIFNDVVLLSNNHQKLIIDFSSKTESLKLPNMTIGDIIPDNIPLNLPWHNLFNSHIAIFGNTGSGKSNTLAKIYHELFDLDKNNKIEIVNSSFVLFDFNGEYTQQDTITQGKQIIELNTRKDVREIEDESKISIPARYFWNTEILSVIFGATEQTQKPFINRVIQYYFNYNIEFNHNNIMNDLPKYISQAFSNVYSSESNNGLDLLKLIFKELNIDANTISPWIENTMFNSTNNTFYSSTMIENWSEHNGVYYWNPNDEMLMEEKKKVKYNLQKILIEGIRPFKSFHIASLLNLIYELRYNMAQYDHISPLISRIESRSHDFDKVLNIEENFATNEMFSEMLTVISFKNVNIDVKMLLPLVIAKITYDLQRTKDVSKNYFNLIIDEAHNILSDSSKRESEKWKDYRLEVFEEIIKEGRKFSYFLTISSQRPSDISHTIVSQVHNYFVHRLVNENDLRLLDNTMTAIDQVTKSNIPNLSPGQVILSGTAFDFPIMIKVTRLAEREAPTSDNISIETIWKVNE